MASADRVENLDEGEDETSSSSDGEENEANSDDDDDSGNSSEEEEKKENEGSDDDSKDNSDDVDGEDEETASEQDNIQEAEEVDEAEAMEIDDDDDKVIAMATAGAMEAVGLTATKVALIPPPKGLLLSRPSLSTGSGGNKTMHPKMRIKLSLKLPTQANAKRKLPTMAKSATTSTPESEEEDGDDDDDAVKAMVVDSDEVADAVAVPTSPVASFKKESKPKLFKKSLPISKAATGTASKRRSFLPSKQIRLPPITSPGLLMLRPPPGSGQGPKQAAVAALMSAAAAAAGTGFLTPQQIFETTMSSAGYTTEQRAAHPHRGSSVQRTIGDIFDTNVKLALHKLELVPEELWNGTIKKEGKEGESSLTLPQLLIQGLEVTKQKQQQMHAESNGDSSRKRRRFAPRRLRDMVPVSLTIPYPEEYIKKRLDYVEDVKSRENAIVQWQVAQEELEIAREECEHRELNAADYDAATNGSGEPRPSFTNPVTIPPIPEPPEPPRLNELVSPPEGNESPSGSTATSVPTYYYLDSGRNSPDSQHPIYIPKGKEDFVAHLDKNCFHIADGRYFGLQTNCIADPNYVGPNAPGLAAMSATGIGGGLATATTSTTTSTSGLTGGGMTMILSASFHSAAAIPPNKDESTSTTKVKSPSPARDDSGGNSSSKIKTAKFSPQKQSGASPSCATGNAAKPEESAEEPNLRVVPAERPPEAAALTASGSASDLRKIMEDEASRALAETFKDWIVRAAVHSGRTQQKETSFRGPNGEIYPDLGKAFALYGGVKPCERCKNNKQGVFHCRVRRRHKEPDYDGGSSTDVLKPLFAAPLETLLLGGEP